MSGRRFAAYAGLAAGFAALLLLVAGEIGAVGVVLVAVAEALAVAALVRASSEPQPSAADDSVDTS